MELTDEQVVAMEAVRSGADVFAYSIAMDLREVKRDHPELITITKPMNHYGDGANKEPYFGAILTADGCRALDEVV